LIFFEGAIVFFPGRINDALPEFLVNYFDEEAMSIIWGQTNTYTKNLTKEKLKYKNIKKIK